jgi:hypothetical protein
VILANPQPGTLGNIASMFLEGPGSFRFDVNLIKRIRLAEGKTLELRADALDVTNKPDFANPNTDINSVNFGRITDAGANRSWWWEYASVSEHRRGRLIPHAASGAEQRHSLTARQNSSFATRMISRGSELGDGFRKPKRGLVTSAL